MLTTPHLRRAIRFADGCWWYGDARYNDWIRICGLIAQSGWQVMPLCRSLEISRRTFDRIAEESLGISTKEWLRSLRAVKAGFLLREGWKVGHVAFLLGYSNASDFSREFKRIVGVTPTEYQMSEKQRAEHWLAESLET
jgi:AraC-like DNA-binding protein